MERFENELQKYREMLKSSTVSAAELANASDDLGQTVATAVRALDGRDARRSEVLVDGDDAAVDRYDQETAARKRFVERGQAVIDELKKRQAKAKVAEAAAAHEQQKSAAVGKHAEYVSWLRNKYPAIVAQCLEGMTLGLEAEALRVAANKEARAAGESWKLQPAEAEVCLDADGKWQSYTDAVRLPDPHVSTYWAWPPPANGLTGKEHLAAVRKRREAREAEIAERRRSSGNTLNVFGISQGVITPLPPRPPAGIQLPGTGSEGNTDRKEANGR